MSDDQAGLSRMDRWRRTGGLKTDPIEGQLRDRRVKARPEELGRTCARTPSRDEMPTFVELTVIWWQHLDRYEPTRKNLLKPFLAPAHPFILPSPSNSFHIPFNTSAPINPHESNPGRVGLNPASPTHPHHFLPVHSPHPFHSGIHLLAEPLSTSIHIRTSYTRSTGLYQQATPHRQSFTSLLRQFISIRQDPVGRGC
ncbi:hypothetical protein CROQUDRAFT_85584 [Cronartium quercuum f. sp. fusiforme G11]|uniref:Uncharacterized protein n=1 Tax=Cronartium quercuum f. sp. fusiforme G11 TaxID=708437 RepID=A0A9P6TJ62_9BASI|nr:hypothetical protein CROQUDRAFT_85584 [Cronartium quercuum f. sp. fusiforme G11]